jgi:hypothetical protein
MTFRHDPFPALPLPTTVNPEDISNLGNVTIRGDIRSYAWDGGGSLEGGVDADATGGYLLDSSVGSAQFEGDLFVRGEITVGDLSTAGMVLDGALGLIEWHVGGGNIDPDPGFFSQSVTDFGVGQSLGDLELRGFDFQSGADPSGVPYIRMRSSSNVGAGGNPGEIRMGFDDVAGEMLRLRPASTGDVVAVTADLFTAPVVRAGDGTAAAPGHSFADTDNGMYLSGADVLGFAAGGVTVGLLSESGGAAGFVRFQGAYDQTTGNSADVHVASNGQLLRSTSALKYKSRITTNVGYLADIDLIPTKHYRKDDGRWRYSLIADWLGDQDPLLGVYENGEVESYDVRGVLAVMAAKINRLEKELANA